MLVCDEVTGIVTVWVIVNAGIGYERIAFALSLAMGAAPNRLHPFCYPSLYSSFVLKRKGQESETGKRKKIENLIGVEEGLSRIHYTP